MRKVIGIDIRQNSVTLVLVKKHVKGNAVEKGIQIPIPPSDNFQAGLKSALETAFTNIDISGSDFAVSLPPGHISFRNLEIPFKDKKKIRQILPFELEPHIPFTVDDIVIDFTMPKNAEHPERSSLFIGVIDIPTLRLYMDTLSSVGVDPEIVTVGGYSTALCLANLSEVPDNCIVLDTASGQCCLFAIVSREIRYIRMLTTPPEAKNFSPSLSTEIMRTLAAFEQMLNDEYTPERVYVTGNLVEDKGFTTGLSKALEMDVHPVDLVADTRAALKHVSVFSWSPPRMDNALGLAIMIVEGFRELNFRQGPFAPSRQWVEHKGQIIKSSILAGLVLILLLTGYLIESRFRENKLKHLNNQIVDIFKSTLPDVTRIVDPVQQLSVAVEETRKNTFYPETTKQVRVIDILADLSRLTPDSMDVIFTRMVVGENDMMISGKTDSFKAVDDMKNFLENSSIFKKVTISSTTTEKSGKRISFKLKIIL